MNCYFNVAKYYIASNSMENAMILNILNYGKNKFYHQPKESPISHQCMEGETLNKNHLYYHKKKSITYANAIPKTISITIILNNDNASECYEIERLL